VLGIVVLSLFVVSISRSVTCWCSWTGFGFEMRDVLWVHYAISECCDSYYVVYGRFWGFRVLVMRLDSH